MLLSSKVGLKYQIVYKQECTNCKLHGFKLFKYDDNDVYCELCNTVATYNIDTFKKGLLCISNKSQIDIIKSTYESLKKNKKVPLIKDIDPDAKMINMSSYDIINVFRNGNGNDIGEFNNIKLYFSDKTNYSNYSFNQFTWKPIIFKDYYFYLINDLDKDNLSDNQLNIITKYNTTNNISDQYSPEIYIKNHKINF